MRFCKECGIKVGKGKSYCLDCKKERIKEKDRKYRETERCKKYQKEYHKEWRPKRYCERCNVEIGKGKSFCMDCKKEKVTELGRKGWLKNPYSEWSDEKKKKHYEHTRKWFLNNKERYYELQKNYREKRWETDKEYRKRVKEYRKNYWRNKKK
jgi:hypothetical protein